MSGLMSDLVICKQGSIPTTCHVSGKVIWKSILKVIIIASRLYAGLTHIYPHKPLRKSYGHLQSPGWQSTLWVSWCLIWWFASIECGRTWHQMPLLKAGVIKQHKTGKTPQKKLMQLEMKQFECPYWDQVSINNTKLKRKFPCFRSSCRWA